MNKKIALKRNDKEDRLKKLGLASLIPEKTNKKNNFDKENYAWNNTNPNKVQIQKMLGLLAQELIEFITSNHTYSVGEKIFLQLY